MTTAELPADITFAELTALRQRIAELERAHQEAEQRAQIFEALFQRMPLSAAVYHLERLDDPRSLRLLTANPANDRASGFDLTTQAGRLIVESFPNTAVEQLQFFADVILSGQSADMGEMAYVDEQRGERIFSVHSFPLPNNCLCIVGEDITDRNHAEDVLRQTIAQEETIRAQQAALAELSTPLIPINDRVVVMPLIGSVDSRRAQMVIETLLQGVATSGAQVAILDITGVAIVDTQVANALVRAAQAVQLLGAQVVLTGIRPEVAQTLVGLGADLHGLVTRSNLQGGITYAAAHN